MSQRKSFKKGVRPEITIVSAQPMSASGAKDITYFNTNSNSPKVRSIDQNQSLVLGVDLPHPPRSAPPPRPAEPTRDSSSKAEKSPKVAPAKPSPPALLNRPSPSQGRKPITRPAPPKPLRPKRTQSLGKASDSHYQGMGVPKRPPSSQTTDSLDDNPPNVGSSMESTKTKPPRPKSEVIRHSWATGSVSLDIGDLKMRPSFEPSTSPIADEDSFFSAAEAEVASLPNGIMNGLVDESKSTDVSEETETLTHSPHLTAPRKPARPTIITAGGKGPGRKQVDSQEAENGLQERPTPVGRENPLAAVAGNFSTVAARTIVSDEATLARCVMDSEAFGATVASSPKPVKPPPPAKNMSADKRSKPTLPAKPSLKAMNSMPSSAAAATSKVDTKTDDLRTFHPIQTDNASDTDATHDSDEENKRRRRSEEYPDVFVDFAAQSVSQVHGTLTAPGRPAHAPSTQKLGAIRKGASFDQQYAHETPTSQLPYSSHPERGMRTRAQTAPKIPMKPRRAKSLQRRPSISPPSTPPPPPREEIEMLLSGTAPTNPADSRQAGVEGAISGDGKPGRPVPPQRVSSIDSHEHKMASTVRRSSLQGSIGLDGIRENDQEETRRKPVRPAPPKPMRSFTVSVPRSTGGESLDINKGETKSETRHHLEGLEQVSSKESDNHRARELVPTGSPAARSSPTSNSNDWEMEAKFTGPLLSPGHHKEAIWSEDTVIDAGRVTRQLSLSGGARIRDFPYANDSGGQHSLMPAQRPTAPPVCTPTRPAPLKPPHPSNRKTIQDGQSTASIGESSQEARTEGDGAAQDFRGGSTRSPHRPAPPRPAQISRQKSVNEADGVGVRQLSYNQSEAKPSGIIGRSQSVRSPTRPAPPVHHLRRASHDVAEVAAGHSSLLSRAPPPARPTSLPIRKVSVDSGSATGSEMHDGRERSSSSLMDKILKNMDVSGPHAVALHDYHTADPSDLEFEAGDVIILESRVNAEWLRGSLEGVSGMFPSNFVEIIVDLEPDSSVVEGKGDPGPLTPFDLSKPHAVALHGYLACTDGELSFEPGETIELLDRDQDFFIGFRQGVTGRFPVSCVSVLRPLPEESSKTKKKSETDDLSPKVVPTGKATFAFRGDSDEDLSFEEGDVITLLERINDEWYRGELGGKTGMFPVGFVDILVDLPEDHSPMMKDEDEVDSTTFDVGLVPQAKALFDFKAMDEGELSFKAGDLIRLRKRLEDDWYEGATDGKVGTFPAGFVEVLTPLPIE